MSDDDPERRIADLEAPLIGSAAASESLSSPPRVGLRLGWIGLGLLTIGLVVGGGAILSGRFETPLAGRPDSPPMIGGGGTVPESPSVPTTSRRTRSTSTPAVAPPSTPPPGGQLNIAGVGNSRTIECADNVISVSGVDNMVVLTGHCSRVDVSGVDNTVTIDGADAIAVSGMNNKVKFRSGTPALTNSGFDNVLEPG